MADQPKVELCEVSIQKSFDPDANDVLNVSRSEALTVMRSVLRESQACAVFNIPDPGGLIVLGVKSGLGQLSVDSHTGLWEPIPKLRQTDARKDELLVFPGDLGEASKSKCLSVEQIEAILQALITSGERLERPDEWTWVQH